jgi:undecaprenyl-diphosphatase
VDEQLLLALNGLRSPALDGVLGFLGSWGYLALPVIVFLLYVRERHRPHALRSLLDGWLAFLLSLFVVESVIKPLVDRPRPSSVASLEGTLHVLGRASASPSFPSGTATACAAVVAWIYLRHRDRVGQATLAFTLLLGVLTSLARVYGGAHWPSDILAGWICGVATAYGIERITRPANV